MPSEIKPSSQISQQIQQKIGPEGTLVGLDRDPMMLGIAKQRLSSSNSRLRQASYAELQEILQDEGLPHADRILLDLGYSSDQLLDESRGFGFESDGPLDLRFDTSIGKPAWKLIQQLSDTELEDILKQYGEERFSRSIAKHLVARRSTNPIRTAADLANAVVESVGKRTGRQSRRSHFRSRRSKITWTIISRHVSARANCWSRRRLSIGPCFDSMCLTG